MENIQLTAEERITRLEQRLNNTIAALNEHARLTARALESIRIAEQQLLQIFKMGRRGRI